MSLNPSDSLCQELYSQQQLVGAYRIATSNCLAFQYLSRRLRENCIECFEMTFCYSKKHLVCNVDKWCRIVFEWMYNQTVIWSSCGSSLDVASMTIQVQVIMVILWPMCYS